MPFFKPKRSLNIKSVHFVFVQRAWESVQKAGQEADMWQEEEASYSSIDFRRCALRYASRSSRLTLMVCPSLVLGISPLLIL